MSHVNLNFVTPDQPKRAASVISNPAVSTTRDYEHDPEFLKLVENTRPADELDVNMGPWPPATTIASYASTKVILKAVGR